MLHLTRRRVWDTKDDRILRERYRQTDNATLAELLGRSETAVARRLSDLGLRRAVVWTKERDALLRTYYAVESDRELADRLKTTDDAIGHRLRALGLRRSSEAR